MKKIAIFGGTFDPPHIEHANILRAAISQFKIDECLVMPSANPPHKSSSAVTPASHRLNMARLAFNGIDGAVISDYEIERDDISYTYLTLEHFKAQGEMYLILGGDSVRDIYRWRNADRILELAKIILVKREGAEFSGGVDALECGYVGKDVSSTAIRTMLEFGVKCEFIDGGVRRYIDDNGLYRRYFEYIDFARQNLTEKRFLHTMQTVIKAQQLSALHGLNVDGDSLFIAATLHDVGKYADARPYADVCVNGYRIGDLPESVRHAFVGEIMARERFKNLSEDVFLAIRYHTTFFKDLTALQKLVGLADAVEDTRSYYGVQEIKKLADTNIDEAILKNIQSTIRYLRSRQLDVHECTLIAEDYFKEMVGKNIDLTNKNK